jgi:hypothetical protein
MASCSAYHSNTSGDLAPSVPAQLQAATAAVAAQAGAAAVASGARSSGSWSANSTLTPRDDG